MIICKSCGNTLPDEAKFCSVCGAPVSKENTELPNLVLESPASQAAEETPAAEIPADENASAGAWYQSAEPKAAEESASNVYYAPVVPSIGSVFDFYRKAFNVLKEKPIRLWGISLLYVLIAAIISGLGSFVPIISLPIILVLSLGFTGVLLDGYHGKSVRSEQLFQGFRKEEVLRNGAGMCWMELWMLIWGFVPVMNIIKSYSYCFTPYILLTDKQIGATDALKKSMRLTDGYKAKMFWAELLLSLCISVAIILLVILSRIPYIGWIFIIAIVLLYIAILLFLPIFLGLLRTAFFEEISKIKND